MRVIVGKVVIQARLLGDELADLVVTTKRYASRKDVALAAARLAHFAAGESFAIDGLACEDVAYGLHVEAAAVVDGHADAWSARIVEHPDSADRPCTVTCTRDALGYTTVRADGWFGTACTRTLAYLLRAWAHGSGFAGVLAECERFNAEHPGLLGKDVEG